MTDVFFNVYESPVGPLTLTASEQALTGLYFEKNQPVVKADWKRDDARFTAVIAQLGEYFAGERTRFDLPLEPEGTAFQKRVWMALREIPFGVTRSYGEIAKRIGSPTASRAVGAANGQNPISIIVPCHRVIGASGSLTGFGGGLPRKKWLLSHEAEREQGELPLGQSSGISRPASMM